MSDPEPDIIGYQERILRHALGLDTADRVEAVPEALLRVGRGTGQDSV